MLTIYNKIEKSMENTSGFQIVPEIQMLERPFLLCISAKNNLSKSIFGIMREGAQAARIQTTQGPAGRFKLDEFPVDILGLRFEKDVDYNQPYVELADNFLYPFLTKKGMSLDSLRRQARKMNIFTYCDGAYTYKGAEERLEFLLRRDGFSSADIHSILSQISLTIMESVIEAGKLHATSVTFVDVNDSRVDCDKTDSYRNMLTLKNCDDIYSQLGDTNGVLYVYKGSGIHNIKRFFKDEHCVAKVAVCAVVSMFLENSLENELGGDLFTIEVPQIISRLDRFANPMISVKNSLIKLDDSLCYNGAPRYSESSIEVKMELDAVYKLLRKTNEAFIRSLNEKQGQDIRLKTLIHGIHEYSSDVTFEQILTYSHMWYPKEDRNILSIPSDKQIRHTIIDHNE